ncbi:hypothetical protein [Haliangium sp.]|uniref:hypothetical protein n=1 Tax=Haliangium sp. TaxID=2663208 RepID=UPI003D0D2210
MRRAAAGAASTVPVALAVIALGMLVAPGAHADESDPNLPTVAQGGPGGLGGEDDDDHRAGYRDGFLIGVGLGSGTFQGVGVDDLSTVGGTLSLRVGTVATERLLWVLQADLLGGPQRTREGDSESTSIEQLNTITLGAQYYLRQVVWLKAGLGMAVLSRVVNPSTGEAARHSSAGPALATSLGYDMVRLGSFVLDLELGLGISLHEGGAAPSAAVRLAATWY